MAELGLPFQGDAWYYVEDSYGSTVTNDDTALPISCKIQDMRYGIGDKHKELRGFDKPNACHLLEQCSDLTLHLEYIPQCDDTLIEDVCNRTAEYKLQSLAFVLETNDEITTMDDRSSFLLKGCKPKTVRISSSINNEYIITIDFSVKEVDSCASDSGGLSDGLTKPTALSGDYLAFNVAGSITKDGTDFAYITESVDITIEHNITDKYDHDSLVKQYAVEGAYDIGGNIDISLDEGGRAHAQEILNQTEFDVVINLGGSGCPRITIPNCKWKSGEIDANTSGDILSDSAPFTGKPTDGDIQAIVDSIP
jgi:hypothetical protein